MEGNRILVSVVTITYNHEKYIRDCLEGIVMQKTDFAFELLIHDDASTDNTANIIREYEHRFPDIIKPIYQTENQYSKGVPLGKTFLYPRAIATSFPTKKICSLIRAVRIEPNSAFL